MADMEDSRLVMAETRNAPQFKAVDAWIASDLARRYDCALVEPLPGDLLALLRE